MAKATQQGSANDGKGAAIDLMKYVKGMYRIFDLVSEQGSGGIGTCPSIPWDNKSWSYITVNNKVIIDQDSLQIFINTLCPGAYTSITKVDFKALDKLKVKPIGVYGSKEGIVSLLSRIRAVNGATWVLSATICP